jgi:hypothetical protein
MPYGIKKGGGNCGDSKFAVINLDNSKTMGCHDSEDSAKKQLAALNIAYQKENAVTDQIVEPSSITLTFPNPHTLSIAEDSNTAWGNFKESDYSIEQWRRATLIHPSEQSDNKSDYKLPVREPNGQLNRNGVHAAAAALAGA